MARAGCINAKSTLFDRRKDFVYPNLAAIIDFERTTRAETIFAAKTRPLFPLDYSETS
jgi:hypothetical protein